MNTTAPPVRGIPVPTTSTCAAASHEDGILRHREHLPADTARVALVGEKADSEWQTERFYHALPGKDKEVFTVPGYSHIDLYDKPGAVNPAVEKLTEFFKRTLK